MQSTGERAAPAAQPFFMLIEGSAAEVELVSWALRKLGLLLEMVICASGMEALALLEDMAVRGLPLPRFVLLEVRMQSLDGFDVLKRARALPALARLPLVMFATVAAHDDVVRALEGGAAAYVLKPSDFDEYTRVLGAIAAVWGSGAALSDALDASLRRKYFKFPLGPDWLAHAPAAGAPDPAYSARRTWAMVQRLNAAELLERVERLLETAPTIRNYVDEGPDNLAWRKRTQDAVGGWNVTRGRLVGSEIRKFNHPAFGDGAYRNVIAALQQARTELLQSVEAPDDNGK